MSPEDKIEIKIVNGGSYISIPDSPSLEEIMKAIFLLETALYVFQRLLSWEEQKQRWLNGELLPGWPSIKDNEEG